MCPCALAGTEIYIFFSYHSSLSSLSQQRKALPLPTLAVYSVNDPHRGEAVSLPSLVTFLTYKQGNLFTQLWHLHFLDSAFRAVASTATRRSLLLSDTWNKYLRGFYFVEPSAPSIHKEKESVSWMLWKVEGSPTWQWNTGDDVTTVTPQPTPPISTVTITAPMSLE